MQEAVVEGSPLATLADLSAAVTKDVGGADHPEVVRRQHDGHAVATQNGQDGLRDLSPDEVDVGDVGLLVAEQLVHLTGRLKVVEVIDKVLGLAKYPAAGLFRFGEVVFEGGGEVALPFEAEIDHLVAVCLQ